MDSTNEFRLNDFEQIVTSALDPSSPNHKQSMASLVRFKESSNSWNYIDTILSQSKNTQAHFIALQILEQTIKSKWNAFGNEQKESLRNFIIQQILSKAKEGGHQILLEKFNMSLVEILKRDWPKRWPTFIPDIVNASQSSGMEVCANSLCILKRLNDDIFIFSDITTVRKRMLTMQMKKEFVYIFNLINNVLEWAKTANADEKLMLATFSALESFVIWMPLSFICESNIIENVCFFINSRYCLSVLKCLSKIVDQRNIDYSEEGSLSGIKESPEVYILFEQKLIVAHECIIRFLNDYFAKFKQQKLHQVYSVMDRNEKEFVYVIATLLCSFYFKVIGIEHSDLNNVKQGMRFLLKIGRINEERIFKEILEFWKVFVTDLYTEYPMARGKKRDSFDIHEHSNLSKALRRDKYEDTLKSLIDLMINKMPRPEEVFITENEYGEIVKEKMTESDQIEFYKNMKETFFYLCFLDKSYTINTINSKISVLFEEDKFSWDLINQVSWSAGCVAGALEENEESTFFVNILKELLTLCEMRYIRADKAVIASNIMFLIGQYDRFILANVKFLRTVVKKLFEFMGESHEGVKDMACDSFLKISDKCAKIFVTQVENNENFCQYLLKSLKVSTSSLEYYQKRIVYEALCKIIVCAPANQKPLYVNLLVDCFNCELGSFKTQEELKRVCHCLRSCSILFSNIPETINMLGNLHESFIAIFEFVISNNINNGHTICTEILTLFTVIIKQGRVVPIDINLINVFFERILKNFKVNYDSNFLALASEIVKNIETVNPFQRDTFFITHLFEPLKNLPLQKAELKLQYFSLVNSLVIHSFDSFASLCWSSTDLFDSIYTNILNGLSDEKEVNELALEILDSFIKNMLEKRNFPYFQKYSTPTLENILGIVFDRDMGFSFDKQCSLLALFILTLTNPIMVNVSGTGEDNKTYVHNYVTSLFVTNFPNLSRESVHLFSVGLFDLAGDVEILKDHVSDFRVKMCEFYGNEELEDEMKLGNERKELVVARSGSFK